MSGSISNLWSATAQERVAAPTLEGAAKADLVIVGGGFTGCSTALFAAEAGLSVRLLEAETIGHGGSGRNVGLVNAGLWLPPESIAARLGGEAGAKLSAALAEAPDLVFALIERLAIACEPVRNGTLHCAETRRGLAELQDRQRQLAAQGAPVTLLAADEAARRTGTAAFLGALHDARAGVIQPLAYCQGLARAALAAGARLHENSPARRIRREGDVWRVDAGDGAVFAPRLLLATNAYHRELGGAPAPRSVAVSYFQMATRPLPPEMGEAILPGGEGAWDCATVMSSFRRDQAGRLIVGGIGALERFGAGAHRNWAARFMATLFPQIAGLPFEHAWCGRIAMTSDHLPKILRLGPNGYAIFGYSGRGIGPGTVFGRAAARAFAGADEAAFPIAPQNEHMERFTAVRRRYYAFGAALAHLAQRRASRIIPKA